MIVDFHTHTFPEKIAARVMDKLGRASGIVPSIDGTAAGLSCSQKEAGIDLSVNLPVATVPGQAKGVNASLIRNSKLLKEQGILTFGCLHPEDEDWKEQIDTLAAAEIPGIKLHPAYQRRDFDDIAYQRIVGYATEKGMIVLIHAGMDIGIYDRNYASVDHIQNVLKTVAPEKLVLAHLGGWADWQNVEKYLCGAPVWFDTAFTIGPVSKMSDVQAPPLCGTVLEDEAFLRISRKHGIEKVLFATDCPWQAQKRYVERFETIGLTTEEKQKVFSENALKLLNI